MKRLVSTTSVAVATLLALAAPAFAGPCDATCDSTAKACGVAGHAARRACLRGCRASNEPDEPCVDRCRARFADARNACHADVTACHRKCEAAIPQGPCPQACLTDRAECLKSLQRAGELQGCRKGCQAEARRQRRACVADRPCRRRAADDLATCMGRCATGARQAQKTCHGSFDSCLAACPPAPSATPGARDPATASPGQATSGGATPGASTPAP